MCPGIPLAQKNVFIICTVSSSEPVSQMQYSSISGRMDSSIRAMMALSFLTIILMHIVGARVSGEYIIFFGNCGISEGADASNRASMEVAYSICRRFNLRVFERMVIGYSRRASAFGKI
jgi:hypothetical protein